MICGQKVVCVDDSRRDDILNPAPNWIVKGNVYIIRDVMLELPDGEIYLLLVGVINPHFKGQEVGFDPDRFRLLENAKLTDEEYEQYAEALFTS